MHTVNKIIQTSITDHMQLIQEITETFAPIIEQVVTVMMTSLSNGGGVFWYGNGGSAATSSHFAVDLSLNAKKTSINFNESDLITCFANDFGYENWKKFIDMKI